MTALKELGWRKVAALTQDGAKYSDYMSTLQVQYSTVQYSTVTTYPRCRTSSKTITWSSS